MSLFNRELERLFMKNRLFLILLLTNVFFSAHALDECKFYNNEGIPCVDISKTPNTSSLSKNLVNKFLINKEDIVKINAVDIVDVLKIIPGLDVFQSGQRGQQTSVFTRGSESNHTLVLLNGVPINDQSTTDGLHDFGQDFIQSIQQIEVYKGANGAHFGPSAIGGAVNLITSIDYNNNFSISGFNKKNNSTNLNYTKINQNDWYLNFNAALNQSESDSAIANGQEDDGVFNQQYNLNLEKWLSDNYKLKSTFYTRQTTSDYDSSSSNERGYVSENKMYAIQSGLDYKSRNSEGEFKLHYHNYDRDYENGGYLDEYYSEAIFLKGEYSKNLGNKISYGYGSEYKYDWGNFENRGSYSASTRGHMKNSGFFSNIAISINENQLFSLHGRVDEHNTTGLNSTYKINFAQNINNHSIGLIHSTGLRNPSLYELYGSDNFGIVGNTNLNPEKSETNEININTKFSKNLSLSASFYRTKIYDRIETNSSYTTYENFDSSINQEGVETNFIYSNNSNYFSLFINSSKSRKSGDSHQARRPDLSYGFSFLKEIDILTIEDLSLNINYKYTGKYLDWNGSGNSFQKSTDLVDLNLKKKWMRNSLSLNITNILNERYEKPATYSQDGRQFRLTYTKSY